jgi:acyl-CoA synthetase (AMP-forming)/AMP-acid ligase II
MLSARDTAVAIATERQSTTYADLADQVTEASAELRAAGVVPGAVVGLEAADEVEHLVLALALLALGTHHITLASHDPENVRKQLLTRARATHRASAQAVHRLPEGLLRAGEGGVYLKTSGTTGDMNIVPFTVEQLRQQAQRHPEYASERLLRLASIEHNNSKRHRLYCAFMGGTNVFRPHDDFDVASFCQFHGVTCLDISRMHASDLAARGELGRFDGVKLRTGGSAIPIDVRRAIEQHVTPLLYVRYASTESGAIAMARPGEHDDDESVGRPLAGVDLEIVTETGEPVPEGAPGLIRLRAAGVATGYLDSGEQSATRFRDGWFWPGDVGRLRPDGTLVVLGRADDMFILNGLNVFPAELERVLESHPAVKVAAASALKSKAHGDIPVAAVELVAGAEVTVLELMTFARERLALRAPRRILVVESLPRNSQGKLLRREVASIVDASRKTQ